VEGEESWYLSVCVCVWGGGGGEKGRGFVGVGGWWWGGGGGGGEQVEVVNAFSVCVLLLHLQEAGRTRRVCRQGFSRLRYQLTAV